MRFVVDGTMNRYCAGAFAALLLLFAGSAGAQLPGVTDDQILFGQSAALGGPAADLGTEMRRGILAAFEETNRAGGVNGRRLELRSYDDRYEPELAIANTRKLIDDDHVFALIGEVGTPTSAAAEPISATCLYATVRWPTPQSELLPYYKANCPRVIPAVY